MEKYGHGLRTHPWEGFDTEKEKRLEKRMILTLTIEIILNDIHLVSILILKPIAYGPYNDSQVVTYFMAMVYTVIWMVLGRKNQLNLVILKV